MANYKFFGGHYDGVCMSVDTPVVYLIEPNTNRRQTYYKQKIVGKLESFEFFLYEGENIDDLLERIFTC